MAAEPHLTFGPFRLERAPGRLWQGPEVIGLRARPLAVLRYLVEHPGRLVTKAELRQHVWGGTPVTDTVLRVCIREIRVALADPVDAPQYLQTVGRQGYQWLGAGHGVAVPLAVARPLVGRQAEVAVVAQWWARATMGERQLGFLSGDAGIGKTTVLDVWLTQLDAGWADTLCDAILLVITDSVDVARHRSSSQKPVNSLAHYRRSACR
jgi:hypothetical protein